MVDAASYGKDIGQHNGDLHPHGYTSGSGWPPSDSNLGNAFANLFGTCDDIKSQGSQSKPKGASESSSSGTLPTHGHGIGAVGAPIASSPEDRTFATSNFKRYYDITGAPNQLEVMWIAVKGVLEAYGTHHNLDTNDFFVRLKSEALHFADDVTAAVERLWTSAQLVNYTTHKVELCSILNAVIREDIVEQVAHAAVLVRGINMLCVTSSRLGTVSFPPGGQTWRGGGFNEAHRYFFEEGKSFRVPGFLASSFSFRKAQGFLRRAVNSGSNLSGVLWTIRVDPKGQSDHNHQCKQANLITKRARNVPDEEEYLFAPYSVFTVAKVIWSNTPDHNNPHKIILDAYTDNLEAPEDLPLSPWY